MSELMTIEEANRSFSESLLKVHLDRAVVMVLDPWDVPRGVVQGEVSGSLEELLNDTGQTTIKIDGADPIAQWSVDLPIEATPTVVIQQGMYRWAGKIDTVDYDFDLDGNEIITWTILHTYDELKHILCWANPLAPASFQWPKAMLLAGPAAWVVRGFLMMNLLRLQSRAWTVPDEFFSAQAWSEYYSAPDEWGIFVVPGPSMLDDPTPWTVLTSRFGNFHDVVADTLASAQLRLATSLWLPGDPQPAPGFATLTKPTVVVDVVWQGGADDVTIAREGGAFRVHMKRIVDGVEDLIEEFVDAGAPDFGNREGGNVLPLCIYRAGEHEPAVPGSGLKIVKPKAYQVVHGGKSPGWVNSSIKLGMNALLGYLGAMIGNPGLALGVFDKQVEDVVLAFGAGKSDRRRDAMGRRPYHEHWQAGGEVGFSLSGLQAQRAGMHATRGYISYRAKIPEGGPFQIGRHFVMGDRVGFEIRGTVWVSRIEAYRLSWDRGKDPIPDISIGDDGLRELASEQLAKRLEKVGASLQAIGVSA